MVILEGGDYHSFPFNIEVRQQAEDRDHGRILLGVLLRFHAGRKPVFSFDRYFRFFAIDGHETPISFFEKEKYEKNKTNE